MTKVIALAGKGGTGKTTVAGMIVRRLVERWPGPVLALDGDANDNLSETLGLARRGSIAGVTDEFASQRDDLPSGMTKEALLEMRVSASISEGRGMDLLVMGHPEGPGCYCYVNNVLRSQIERLQSNYRFVVIDNEAGMEHVSRRTTRKIDLLLLVADYSAKSLRAATRVAQVARELELDVKRTGLILNGAPQDHSALEPELQATGLELLAVLPHSDRVRDNDVQARSVFELPQDDPALVATAELVDRLVADIAVSQG
ncbi:MAG: AAA family ATPase [Candidatus Alcyoniella australis]|nr:AAA family ATPase [Candidatus Alcyoniella australis]